MENNFQQKNSQISTEYYGNQKLQKLSISGNENFVLENFKEITKNNDLNKNLEYKNYKFYYLCLFALFGVLFSFIFKSNPCGYETLFWLLAFTWSGFLGLYAFEIHTNEYYEDKKIPVIIHQFIFNFGLALLGWIIIWFLFIKESDRSLETLGLNHLILLGVALVSLSGYLPLLVSRGNPFKN